MMQQILRTSAVAAALFTSAAQATVIYDWRTNNVGNVPAFTSRIEIDDAAWLFGSVDYQWNLGNSCNDGRDSVPPSCLADPAAPITRFVFDVIGPDATIDLSPRTGIGAPARLQRPLQVNLQFLSNGSLAGSLLATNDATDIGMSGNGLWGIFNYGSDFPNNRVCSGGSGPGLPVCTTTGTWVLNPVTIPVSEPGMLLLVALGAFGMAVSQRPRRADSGAVVRTPGA